MLNLLLSQVHGQLLIEGQKHGLGEGAGGRVEDLGGVKQLTGEDHQGNVIEGAVWKTSFSPCLDE